MQSPIKNNQNLNHNNYTVAYLGVLLAFSLILSYIEACIPFSFGIPGIKLGLSNLAVLFTMELIGSKEATILTVAKAILAGLLFGNLSMIIYSLSGALFSIVIMLLLKNSHLFHLPVISICGGVFHNIGQLIVAYFMVQSYGLLYYVPILLLSGVLTGLLIGLFSSIVLPYLHKIIERNETL